MLLMVTPVFFYMSTQIPNFDDLRVRDVGPFGSGKVLVKFYHDTDNETQKEVAKRMRDAGYVHSFSMVADKYTDKIPSIQTVYEVEE